MMEQRDDLSTLNKSLVVRAITAFFMVTGVLACITRMSIKWFTVRDLGLDDRLAIAATFLAVSQSIVVILETANGLGQHPVTLEPDQVSYVLKSEYAANALYITGLLLAKLSALTTVWIMAPRYHRRTVIVTGAFVVLWALSSIIPALLQCSLPKPWDYINGKCFQMGAFWTYVSIGNILTDLSIIIIMISLFWSLQLPRSKKLLVAGVFGSRILVTPAIIGHIYVFNNVVGKDDSSYNMVTPTILVQIIQCLSIVTVCVPYLKPFLDSFESGLMVVADPSSQNGGTKSGSQRYATARSVHTSKQRRGSIVGTSRSRHDDHELADIPAANTATIVTANQGIDSSMETAWDGQSHTSQTVLVQQTWRVDIEESLPIQGGK